MFTRAPLLLIFLAKCGLVAPNAVTDQPRCDCRDNFSAAASTARSHASPALPQVAHAEAPWSNHNGAGSAESDLRGLATSEGTVRMVDKSPEIGVVQCHLGYLCHFRTVSVTCQLRRPDLAPKTIPETEATPVGEEQGEGGEDTGTEHNSESGYSKWMRETEEHGMDQMERTGEHGEGEEGEEHGEGAGEGEEFGEFEEELEEVDVADLVGAVMLLGSVTFVMSLFYLVHHHDPDICYHSWWVITATVAIFVSVLLFQGLNSALELAFELYLEESLDMSKTSTEAIKVGISYSVFLGFFVFVHVILCYHAFKVKAARESEAAFAQDNQLKMACWSTLYAHVAGFSLIRCCAMVQHFEVFSCSPMMSMIPVLFNTILLVLLFRLSDMIRSGPPFYKAGAENNENAGYDTWDAGAIEAENDIAKIALSFSTVVVLRYLITGQLANHEGLLEPLREHSNIEKGMLYTCGAVFSVLALIIIVQKFRYDTEDMRYSKIKDYTGETTEEGLDSFRVYLERWVYITSNMFATVFSWCTMFATKWSLHSLLLAAGFASHPNSCLQRVILSLIISMGSFGLVLVLDRFADMEWTGVSADLCIKCMIHAIAILVGFSWEQSFDAGVEVISELTAKDGRWYPVFVKNGLAIAVALIMVPAWRKHLLRKVLKRDDKRLNTLVSTAGCLEKCSCGAVFLDQAAFCYMCGEEKPPDEEDEEDEGSGMQ